MLVHRTDNPPTRRTLSEFPGHQQADRLIFGRGSSEPRIRMGTIFLLSFPPAARVRSATLAVGFVLVCLAMVAGWSGHGLAADEPGMAPTDLDPGQPEVTRDEWRQRLEEAKRRSKEVARDRREHPELYAPIPEDPAIVATERLLNDESLRNGDIVSTKSGLFVYRGRGDLPRRSEDFVPVPRRQ
jgi:hypothetical protein